MTHAFDLSRVGLDVSNDVLPLFVIEEGAPARPLEFVGTGFLVKPGVLVTCWHCVRRDLESGQRFAALKEIEEGDWKGFHLVEIAQDANGSDLATAWVDIAPRVEFTLGESVLVGADVLTIGYPLTEPPTEMRPSFDLGRRFLQGYVTRAFHFEHPEFGSVPSYELDMPTPGGLSGAPLILRGSKEVVGVIYGTHDVAMLEQFSSIDERTGERVPEVRRIFSFGLAHYSDTLRELRGPATFGERLIDVVSAPTN